MRINAHQHFWEFNSLTYSWILGGMQTIQRDFLTQHSEVILQKKGIEGTILIRSRSSEKYNHSILSLASQYPFIKGAVGRADPRSENLRARLQYDSQFENLKGLRHVLPEKTETRLMLTLCCMNCITALADYSYTCDVLVHHDLLQFVAQFVAAFPNQRFFRPFR